MRPPFFFLASCCLLVQGASAQVDPFSGIDFVTVGNPGNPAWAGDGNPVDQTIGRGSVDYTYRIGRFEVTTAQWCEFFNAAFDRPASERIPFLAAPTFWGAVGTTPNTPGGQRWRVPAGREMIPVGSISWRTAAIYCNWLCSGKSSARSAFLNGAYDVSTFGYSGVAFTDQHAHTPGSQFWIPTWDEWLKAAHWSPTNPNHDGWYLYSTSSDTAPISGSPGMGQCNTGPSRPARFRSRWERTPR